MMLEVSVDSGQAVRRASLNALSDLFLILVKLISLVPGFWSDTVYIGFHINYRGFAGI